MKAEYISLKKKDESPEKNFSGPRTFNAIIDILPNSENDSAMPI